MKCETSINVALKEKWNHCMNSCNAQGCFLRSSKFPKISTDKITCKNCEIDSLVSHHSGLKQTTFTHMKQLKMN